jgi:Zn-dependent protease with chaperone function
MWCDDEKFVRVTAAEASDLVHAPEQPHDGLLAPDGRVAYSIPLPAHWRRREHSAANKPPEDEQREYASWVRKTQRRIRNTFFFLPPLPPASVRYYNELSATEREQVDALRRYWISLRLFKDQLKLARWAVALLIGVPVLILLGVWATGLERVPFTGRWRLILLTADEEDAVSDSLEGANWFTSVINLLTTPEKPAPPIVPLSDWRWQWVQGTLRHLESGTIAAVERIDAGDPGRPAGCTGPWPPPSSYPLRPRPRAAARLHAALGRPDSGAEHLHLGPPYNVMIMDAPDRNAFSYGFGGKGAGGIVIFTGLLDEIMREGGVGEAPAATPAAAVAPQQYSLFGGLFAASPPPPPQQAPPTEEQTLHLATVIAHEMGHLLLSHHLETLSHQQVLWPSVVGLSVDMLRAFIWPFT